MTNSFEIIKPGLMTSFQDLGRKGFAYYAIPTSGVMDSNAARIALLIMNKSEDYPVLECTSIAPQIKFNAPTQITITGADFNWTLNNQKIHRNVSGLRFLLNRQWLKFLPTLWFYASVLYVY